MIKDKGDFVDLDVIVEKYKKKRVRVKQEDGTMATEYEERYAGFYTLPTTFCKEGIVIWGPVANQKNKVLKTRATVFDKYSGKFYLVKHKPSEIEKSIIGPSDRNVVGFQLRKR